ncbi:unnamed protein product [Arabidopsis arenosa]|uniref:RING-type domain-containing protein n=1 Tax=Arabidopsis arenosa TaxID=38785 RepID=A0A8S1ZXI4_ARAAE|nr:unnamed protein product [Arabidopsis arenosa]
MLTKLETKVVEPRFACPLCNNRFKDATTISECLHTFCRSCIRNKFINERVKACPVCNVNLGVFPLHKLRSDYSWQNLKLKVYTAKTASVKAGPETVAASVKSSKKKGKSLTSLVVSSSRVSSSPDTPLEPPIAVVEPPIVVVEEKHRETVQALQSSRKPIITFKKRGRKSSLPKKFDSKPEPELPPKEPEIKNFFDLNNEPEDNGLDEAEGSTSQKFIPKEKDSGNDLCKSLTDDGKEVAPLNINDTPPLIVEPVISSDGDTEESVEPIHNKCVVNREAEEVPFQVNQNNVLISSDRDREDNSGQKLKSNGASSRSRRKKGKKPVEKSYSLRPRKDGRATNSAANTTTPEVAVSVEEEKKVEGRNTNAVWFSLMPSKTQNIEMLLPPINARCIRVKDRNMTVSYLKKYLMVKLGLESEDQVEIWLRNEPLCSSLTLHSLVDWWVQTTPLPERRSAMVGSSAADFLMNLHYSFKSDASGSGSGSGSDSE